jgi:twinkle protein
MSTVVRHGPCPKCPTRDNNVFYADGGEHCFTPGCGHHKSGDESMVGLADESTPSVMKVLDLPEIKYGPILSRGIREDTCVRYGYGRTERGGSIVQVAPFRDRGGAPVAWKFRAQGKKFSWMGDRSAMLPLFGQHLQSNGRMIVVTEGELDALACSQALGNSWPVVSLPDGAGSWEKSFREALAWLDGFEKIVLCFDMDAPGREAAEAAAKFLPAGKVYIASLPEKDPCDMLRAGKEQELKRALWNASLYSPPGIVHGDGLLAALQGKHREPVAEYPFPKLQAMSRGVRAGEIILVAAASGGGKSTLCRTFIHGFLKQGVKVGVLSLEETLDQFGVPLIGFAMGKNLRAEDGDHTSSPEFIETVERLKPQLALYDDDGTRNPDIIFDRARYMQTALGCDVVVLDHLTVILAAGSDNGVAAADRLMAKLEAHVKKTQMTLVVVMHLRKTGEGKGFEEGKIPTMSDIRGSGLIAGFAHTIIARSRDQAANDGGGLHLLKCRLSGTGYLGPADKLVYDQGTGMLLSEEDPKVGMQAVEDY